MGWTVRDSNSAGATLAATQPPFWWVLWFFLGGDKTTGAWGSSLLLVPWLKMSRAIPLLPLYAFMVWIRTAVPLPFPVPLDLTTLKVACAVHAGLLVGLQHMIRLNPKSWHILEVGRESLSTQVTKSKLVSCCCKCRHVMNCFCCVVSSHECRYTTASGFYNCEDS